MIQELNTFYLKAMLWVPPNHSLNLHREVLYALCGACAVMELYDYLSSRYVGVTVSLLPCFYVLPAL